jgi:hypothetical protein
MSADSWSPDNIIHITTADMNTKPMTYILFGRILGSQVINNVLFPPNKDKIGTMVVLICHPSINSRSNMLNKVSSQWLRSANKTDQVIGKFQWYIVAMAVPFNTPYWVTCSSASKPTAAKMTRVKCILD